MVKLLARAHIWPKPFRLEVLPKEMLNKRILQPNRSFRLMTVAGSVLLDSVIFNRTQHNVGKVQDGRIN